MTQQPVRAGTTVVIRQAPDATAIEVLLLLRPARGSFANAWVFPGGKVETSDGHATNPENELLSAQAAARRETVEECGLVLHDLVPLSRWIPPMGISPRIHTWFFLAQHPEAGHAQQQLTLAADEIVDAVWLSPQTALDQHAAGQLTLFPPTWVTLANLRDYTSVNEALRSTQARYTTQGIETFTTVALPAPNRTLVWEGDHEHTSGKDNNARHRLDYETLPWRYVRTHHP
ncbi:NUDIX hydrolase [Microbacterium sp. YY-01]|uniref:NUDIX hydrolase n=1 Tax=Microbacterium sp. YY-01 TaxID=3421634 RepID=UPI003D16E0AD